ncbi:MAG: hypothetical protein AAF587_02295 [Bacteroidota bacterium]
MIPALRDFATLNSLHRRRLRRQAPRSTRSQKTGLATHCRPFLLRLLHLPHRLCELYQIPRRSRLSTWSRCSCFEFHPDTFRYRDFAFGSTGIALFMYYVSSHVSAFAVESWLYGKSRLAWQGVIIFAVAGILVVIIDYPALRDFQP